jgi:hypothetical protein
MLHQSSRRRAPSVAFGDSSPEDGGAELCCRRGRTILLPRVRGRCPRSGRRGNSAGSARRRRDQEIRRLRVRAAPSRRCGPLSRLRRQLPRRRGSGIVTSARHIDSPPPKMGERNRDVGEAHRFPSPACGGGAREAGGGGSRLSRRSIESSMSLLRRLRQQLHTLGHAESCRFSRRSVLRSTVDSRRLAPPTRPAASPARLAHRAAPGSPGCFP